MINKKSLRMKSIFFVCIVVGLFSCKIKQDESKSAIASLTNKAQDDYLNNTIQRYARLSDTGVYYFKLGILLKEKAMKLKSILQDNKPPPYDSFSTMASAPKWTIKKGEEFEMRMNITAANSKQAAEWYILKDGGGALTKENIIDTLIPDSFGEVTFKTTNYHKGENEIIYAVNLKLPGGNQALYKRILFHVH
jgi:hypothetical protein